MKLKDHKAPAPKAHAPDHLLRLEMKIAQRADQLWQKDGKDRCNGLKHWLQAEREIFSGRPWGPAHPAI
jgi:Protein of unknown function (DUF2934)